ncbi:DUF6132 family protein [Chitinophaga defluvii]|uniref:DUF6132 family protein n=1 Tax=Chitinophaga defluvii TaxID=3163343 RepID=A0ABV2TA27_9BACT
MKKFIKKHLFTLIGLPIGAAAGYLYWKLIGCSTGSCAITANPINSTLYGAAMGGLLLSTFKKDKKQYDVPGDNQQ